ncbi:MAG TPA: hypothetical protein VLP43_00460 [Solirubrobacteraceae bacterium]|nr:hypothetical protein [Solirubrobacteraceae bacterium]
MLPAQRLGYTSLIDFVPGVEPYEQATLIELERSAARTRLSMTMEPLHDQTWTERLGMGRKNELDNLAKLIVSGKRDVEPVGSPVPAANHDIRDQSEPRLSLRCRC